MKKILNKVRWNIVEALKGEEKVPEKGFKITTWVGQYGQHYVEVVICTLSSTQFNYQHFFA